MAKQKSGRQKGPQDHSEGQHGPKTRERDQEILHSSPPEPPRDTAPNHSPPSKHPLFSERELPHDPADSSAEKNRLFKDIERHGHNKNNFQVNFGAASEPALPRHHIDPEHPDKPTPHEGLGPEETPERSTGSTTPGHGHEKH